MPRLTAEGCAARQRNLWRQLPDDVDCAVMCDPASVNYFSGFYVTPFQFRANNAAALLVLVRDGENILVADNLLEPMAAEAHVDRRELPVWYDGNLAARHRLSGVAKAANKVLQDIAPKNVAVESALWDAVGSLLRSAGANLQTIDDLLLSLRRAKHTDEVDLIRYSTQAGEQAHAAALSSTRPGMSELDVYRLIVDAATEEVGEPVLVYGDVVSGPRTLEVGGPPTDRIIEVGDLVILDFSVIVRGYRSDFTNTFVCAENPTAEQTRHFHACQRAMDAVEEFLAPDVQAQQVDTAVREVFREAGLEEFFLTHTGHGIGLSHPEAPFLTPGSDETLVVGDVLAIEPGLYHAEVGGMRFEHNYLVTEQGCERLTQHALRLEQTD